MENHKKKLITHKMSCSKQEIELKRLAALHRRQTKLGESSQTCSSNSFSSSSNQPINRAGPLKTFVNNNNSPKSFHPYAKPESSLSNKSEQTTMLTKVISGTIYLITETRFEVNPSEFCSPLISIFKSIPSRSYDSKSKLWNFLLEDYELLIKKVAPLAPGVVLGALPSYVLKLLREPYIDPKTVDLTPIEPELRDTLMPFQEDGVRFGIAKHGRCMVADDMGLGKTFQALAIASYYKKDWPLLIVTTSSMRETWQSKFRSLLPSVPLSSAIVLRNSADVTVAAESHAAVVITSYKLVVSHRQLLQDKKFGVVIIDESHHLKSVKARCTVSLSAVSRRARRVVLLSGTPALSRPAELYSQLQIIHPNFFQGYTEYGKRYCAGRVTPYGWDMTGQSHLTELQVVLGRKFLIRRTKEQVLTDLQEKVRESVMLDQTLLNFSKEQRTDLSQMAETYVRTKSSNKHAALLTFFSESAKVKVPAVCKYIKEQMEKNATDKFLVFAHHRVLLDAVSLTLDECAVHYICIVGDTPTNLRADLVDLFQTSSSCRVAVLSLTAAGAGLTLTAARIVLFAELHWNPGVLTQAESRAHRLGQAGAVRVRYLLARGTADDYIWPMLRDKLQVLNEVGLSKDTFEDATVTRQDSKNDITQYLSQKNKEDYIPGTNLRKDYQNRRISDTINGLENRQDKPEDIDKDKSFLEDNEGDELLANIDF